MFALESFMCQFQDSDADAKLTLLKAARRNSGLSLDFWEFLTDGLDQRNLEILVGRSSVFPKYINSSDNL